MTNIKRLRMAEAGRRQNWIYLFTTLGISLCVTEARFTIQTNIFNFDKALEACQPGGFLTNIASLEEVYGILEVVSNTLQHNQTHALNPFNFWIGLKSGRDDCVVSGQPLRGFKWVVDVSSDPAVGQWRKEPAQTCTGTRCALLSGEFNGTDLVNWGLVSSSCKTEYPIICKEGEGEAQKEACLPLEIPDARSQSLNPDGSQMVECWTGEIHTVTCSPVTHRWTSVNSLAVNEGICPSCEDGFERDSYGSCVDVDECLTYPCKNLCINSPGSYTCHCFDQLGDIHNEGSPSCNESITTSIPPEEVTKPHGPVTQVNTPSLGLPIPGRPSHSSPPASPNSPASPTDGSQVLLETQTNVFIPVLIAVMGLVVLLVVVLAVVKCCLRTRSRKLTLKKSEQMAMKRAEAAKQASLKGQDSMEHTSEKEAT